MLTNKEITPLLADAYRRAAQDAQCDMRLVADLFEGLRSEFQNADGANVWSRVPLNKKKFDQPGILAVLVELKTEYFRMLLEKFEKDCKEKWAASPGEGWKTWIYCYVNSLVSYRGELFVPLCEMDLKFSPEQKKSVEEFRKLNRYFLETRWEDAYPILEKLLAEPSLTPEQQIRLHLTMGETVLYRFPNPESSSKHFDAAQTIDPSSCWTLRGLGEFYCRSGDRNKGREYLLRAISGDANDVNNYLLMGDSYGEEVNLTAAEQWYRNATELNFLFSDSYDRLISFLGKKELFKDRHSEIMPLVEKVEQLEPTHPLNNNAYTSYRNAGYAFSFNKQIDDSIACYRKAIEKFPHWNTARIDLAYAFGGVDKLKEAKEMLKEVEKSDPENYDLHLAMAWLAEKSNMPGEALSHYEKCISLRPFFAASVNNNIGWMYEQVNQYDKALQYYEKTVHEDENNELYWNNYAGAAEKKGDYESALNAYTKISKISPDNPLNWNKLGNQYYALKEYDKAIEAYQSAQTLDPAESVYWTNIGLAYRQQGKWEQSKEAYLKGLSVNPQNHDAANGAGIACYMLHEFDNAAAQYLKAINLLTKEDEKNDMLPTYWANLGLNYRDGQKWKEAQHAYEMASALRPKDAELINAVGNALFNQMKFEEAIAHYKKATLLKPNFDVYFENLGLACRNVNRYDESLAAFEQAVKLNDKNELALNELGNFRFNAGDLAGARSFYQQAMEVNNKNSIYISNLARTYYEEQSQSEAGQRDYSVAKDLFERATQLSDNNDYAWNFLGNILFAQEMYNEALEKYEKARSLNPEEPFYHSNCGLALIHSGKIAEAETSFKEALKLRPDFAEALNGLGLAAIAKENYPAAVREFYLASLAQPANSTFVDNLKFAAASVDTAGKSQIIKWAKEEPESPLKSELLDAIKTTA